MTTTPAGAVLHITIALPKQCATSAVLASNVEAFAARLHASGVMATIETPTQPTNWIESLICRVFRFAPSVTRQIL